MDEIGRLRDGDIIVKENKKYIIKIRGGLAYLYRVRVEEENYIAHEFFAERVCKLDEVLKV